MTHSLQLETPRLILRPARDSDRAPYAAMNADPAVMTYFASPMTREESDASLARFQAAYERDGFGFLTAELRSTGAFAGIIGAQTMRDAVPNLPQPAIEIGWRLPRALHGQGLATEGARATVDFCFNQLNLPAAGLPDHYTWSHLDAPVEFNSGKTLTTITLPPYATFITGLQ